MFETTRLPDGITQMRLPMAGNPMKYVNAYLLEDDEGPTLVDCGWKADDVREALDAGLAAAGLSLGDVRRLLVTHVHFDHYGLAGSLLRAGVPELGMHADDAAFARGMLADHVASDKVADEWLAANGLPAVAPESDEEEDYYKRTELCEPTRLVADGERVGRLRAVHTPGHTPGHLCFVDERTGAMLTGDHVLPRITPHVGMWHPSAAAGPLGPFVASLEKVRALGATRVLPAHLEPFDDLGARVGELLAHHEKREGEILAALRAPGAGALSGAAVARAIGWTGRNLAFDTLDGWHRQFAVAETLAHLEYLRAKNEIRREDRGGSYVYEA